MLEQTLIARFKSMLANARVPKNIYFLEESPRTAMGRSAEVDFMRPLQSKVLSLLIEQTHYHNPFIGSHWCNGKAASFLQHQHL